MKQIKRKYANLPEWKRVIEKEYKQTYVDDSDFTGYLSLVTLKKVNEPLYVTYGNKDKVCIAGNGYSWLEYFPLGKNHCLTTIFNEKGEVKQWYFDIAKEAALTEDGIPYFEDLYLDVVVLPNDEYFLLDEDELHEALDGHIITINEYNLAKNEAEKLIKSIKDGSNTLLARSPEDLKRI